MWHTHICLFAFLPVHVVEEVYYAAGEQIIKCGVSCAISETEMYLLVAGNVSIILAHGEEVAQIKAGAQETRNLSRLLSSFFDALQQVDPCGRFPGRRRRCSGDRQQEINPRMCLEGLQFHLYRMRRYLARLAWCG